LQQIPLASPRVDENRDAAVALAARLLQESDPPRAQDFIICLEVVGEKKVAHSAAGLIADPRPLSAVGRNRQYEPGSSAARWRHCDPTLVLTEVSIFDHLKAKSIAEKA
jgi:hypothetical protein